MMDQIDIEKFRLDETHGDVPNPKIKLKTKIDHHYVSDTWFIAPIPGPWIAEAARLPGHALHVALAIMYVHGMKPGKVVSLTRYHFNLFSTSRGSARRGLEALQQAGLIKFVKKGYKYRVTVLPVKPQTGDMTMPDNSK